MRRLALAFSVLSLSLVFASPARAAFFTGTSGSLSASADFSLSGGNLIVVLTNTATVAPTSPADVLTGVFFTASDSSLLAVSATLTPGSDIANNGIAAGSDPTVVGGEWAYDQGISGPGGAAQGIASAGYLGGTFFPGADLQAPASLDGVEYGITSKNYVDLTGNGGLTGDGTPGTATSDPQHLIRNSVTFNLGPYSGPLNITKVSFQYGTALNEPNVPSTTTTDIVTTAVPEPTTLALLGSGLLVAVRGLRRRGKNARTVA
jgi:hypothetical protein